MKNIVLLVFFMLLALHAKTQNDFRNTQWGMTREQVKEAENLEKVIHEQERLILTLGEAADMECFIIYYFLYDTLVRAQYVFNEQHQTRNEYIADFEIIKGILTEKYGTPENDEELWMKDQYKDDSDLRGLAVSEGHLTYVTKWESEKTIIGAILSGSEYVSILEKNCCENREELLTIMMIQQEFKIKHFIMYTSKNYIALKESLKEEKKLDDF